VPSGSLNVELGDYRLTAATDFGPRLTGLRFGDGPELLAVLEDDIGIELTGGGFYRFGGGHRLWAAPEVPEITYQPDGAECDVEWDGRALQITGPVDGAGLRKRLQVTWEGGRLVVDHSLANEGTRPVRVAAWAITQFPLGGVATLPLAGHGDGLQADRSLVLWPYTDLADKRLGFEPWAVTVSAQTGPPLKIGAGPEPATLAYLREGVVFKKEIAPVPSAEYPDRGAIAQIYVGPHFCELETVGPLSALAAGGTTTLREIWTVSSGD